MHLPGELRKLRKVCKRFYNVINSSLPLMMRVTAKWHSRSDYRLKGDSYKFYNVNLQVWEEKDLSKMMSFIERHAGTLKRVDLIITPCVHPDIHRIFSILFGRLEELTFNYRSTCVLEPPLIHLNKLRSLTVTQKSLDAFTKRGEDFGIIAKNLKAFTYQCYLDNEARDDLPDLMSYLRSQPQLEEVHLTRLAAREFLRESAVNLFPFKLKKATFDCYPKTFGQNENVQMNYPYDDTYTIPLLRQFIVHQMNSLRHLVIENAVLKDNEVVAILASKCTKVELLSVDVQCIEHPAVANTTIKSLSLGERNDDNRRIWSSSLPRDLLYCFVDYCRGLQSLELNLVELDIWWSMVLADLEWLDQLKLNKSVILPLPMHSLERLEIFMKDESGMDVWIGAFIRMNPTLETVNVPNHFQKSHLFEAVTGDIVVEFNMNGDRYKDEDDGYIIFEDSEPEEDS